MWQWTLGLLLLSAVLGSGQAYAQDSDPWLGRDKALHFSASASLAVIGYSGAALVTDDRPSRVAAATVLALGAGVGKELWDLNGPGDASWRDLTWDVIGTATGILVASGIDWLIHHFSEPDPVAGTR